MARKTKPVSLAGLSSTVLEYYLGYGIDLKNRIIDFGPAITGSSEDGSDFDYYSVNLAIRGINLMVQMSNKKPIEIHMCSYGGDPYFMMALKDKILESPVKFIFRGSGKIASAATWIMVVCDERYLSTDTTVMIHNGGIHYDGSSGEEKTTDRAIDIAHDLVLQDRLSELFAENSRMPKSFWDAVVKRDCYITAKEAYVLGLIEGITPHVKRGNLRHKREKNLKSHPSKRNLNALSKRLLERIQANDKLTIEVHVPEEQYEDIPEYDNSEEQLELLANKPGDVGDDSDNSGS